MEREDNPTQTLDQPVDPCPPDPATIDRLLGGAHHDPHSVLGAHPHPRGVVIRVLRPHADEVHVVRLGGQGFPLVRVHEAGLFSGVVPGPPADYRLAVRYGERVDIVDDPYRWLPTLGEMDLHLISEGRHERLWDVLGAHVRHYDTPAGAVTGTSFAVWAPTAQGVRVTGDFDGWSGWAHPMRVLGSTGVWEIFVPGIEPGTRYKFRILGQDGRWRDKADPMAFATEIPPATASVVDASTHEWGDGEWMATRAAAQAHAEPMSVYEVHLGSWKLGLNYRQLAEQLVEYLDETGFTHVELLPVAEHPFGGSWGYQVTSYYAPTSRFGSPDEFRWFVDHLHQHGYGVIVDWVPAHFPRDEWALAKFDGTPLYEHADPRRGEQPDWGTLVFDFGRREVRNFLVANALFWLDEYHIDGLRVDAVASMLYLDYSRPEGQWLPNIHGGRENLDAVAFLQEVNATVYRLYPGAVTIAEESTAWPGVTRPTHLGGLGFGLKWNMGWMHDTLDYIGRDPIYRGYHHNQMTFSLMYAFSENFVLPLSHDEVVHGKGSLWTRMPGDAWNKAAGVRALLAYMWAHPGKQLLFQGGEFGQEREWSEARSLDWHLLEDPLHAGIKSLVGDLNRAYRSNPALWTRDSTPDGFSWIDANDTAGNVFSFLRHGVDADGKPTVLACVANFSGTPKPDYRVGLPFAGRWREVLNTDADVYGGSGVGNFGAVEADRTKWHGRPASAVLQLPPSGVLWLVPEPFEGAVSRLAAAEALSAPAAALAVGAADVPAAPGAPAADEESVLDADAAQAPAAPSTVPGTTAPPATSDDVFSDDVFSDDTPTGPIPVVPPLPAETAEEAGAAQVAAERVAPEAVDAGWSAAEPVEAEEDVVDFEAAPAARAAAAASTVSYEAAPAERAADDTGPAGTVSYEAAPAERAADDTGSAGAVGDDAAADDTGSAATVSYEAAPAERAADDTGSTGTVSYEAAPAERAADDTGSAPTVSHEAAPAGAADVLDAAAPARSAPGSDAPTASAPTEPTSSAGGTGPDVPAYAEAATPERSAPTPVAATPDVPTSSAGTAGPDAPAPAEAATVADPADPEVTEAVAPGSSAPSPTDRIAHPEATGPVDTGAAGIGPTEEAESAPLPPSALPPSAQPPSALPPSAPRPVDEPPAPWARSDRSPGEPQAQPPARTSTSAAGPGEGDPGDGDPATGPSSESSAGTGRDRDDDSRTTQ